MKFFIASYCLLFFVHVDFAQQAPFSKPIIDSAAINHWPSLSGTRAISNDGKYFMYSVDNQPVGSNTMIVKSTEGAWQREFVGVATGVFSGDNKEFIFQDADTLFFLSLSKGGIKKISGVASYSQPANVGGRWLVYQLKDEQQELVIYNFLKGEERRFNGVKRYLFNETLTNILMITNRGLEWAYLQNGKVSVLWSQNDHPGLKIGGYAIDKKGRQVSFLTTVTKESIKVNTIWYYQEGVEKAYVKVTDGTKGIEPGLIVAGSPPQFSVDGHTIFFHLTGGQQVQKPLDGAVSLDVWNWKDSILQSAQIADHSVPEFWASVGTKDDRVIQFQHMNDECLTYPQEVYAVISHNNNPGDRFWLDKPDSTWLISVRNGARTALNLKGVSRYGNEYYFSPDGHYLVYYDCGDHGNFFSIDLITKEVRKISSGVPDYWLTLNDGFTYRRGVLDTGIAGGAAGLAGWLSSDTALLVYDNYDIWKLSLNGSRAPENITRGYGRQNHIKFRVNSGYNGLYDVHQSIDSLLLIAFGTANKYNGFYRVILSSKSGPELLTMGPWAIWHAEGTIAGGLENFAQTRTSPLKAAEANKWVIERSTATEAPNYFFTKDFKNYKPLTDLQPQKKYNWLTSELMDWVQPDGIKAQGVLYKPENFDPNNKYPVIIHYYEHMSHRIYEFSQAEYANGNINIPWFVSRGYLVFTPDVDINYEIGSSGNYGPSAVIAIESAGRMLAKLNFVDSTKMGIEGHSYGGSETYYVWVHTHLFAAALVASAGVYGVDMISQSLSCESDAGGGLVRFEGSLGATLWQRPDLWVKNSNIFQVDKVTTPLLILQNHGNGPSTWARTMEMFIALRRLEKPVWILQYDHGGHGVEGKDAEDYTIRMTQFFDYYLKGAPSPIWMSHGIRATDKGIKYGLELDSSNTAP